MKIKLNNEIGKLKKVLLHRPGKEVERQYPEIFEHTLFDDIMYVENAQKEHDVFADKLRENGVEVLYIENLVAEIFDNDSSLRKQFLNDFIKEAGIVNESLKEAVFQFFDKEKNNLEFVKKVIAGVIKGEIKVKWDQTIESYVIKNNSYPFYVDPLPNLLFQRDPIASIYNGMNIHNMTKSIRKREGIFYEYLIKHHPQWKGTITHLKRDHEGNMEGGDVLVISKETLFIGISERTTAKAIEMLSKSLFKKHKVLKSIIGIHIPESHATMHLDTVLTHIDYDKFLVDADMIKKDYFTYYITYKDNKININADTQNIKKIIEKYVDKNAKMFVVAEGKPVFSKAEQWNDGANCLVLEPGVIFVYDRNIRTNRYLEKNGIKSIKIPSGELSRGRGGPRCMAMPLEREEI